MPAESECDGTATPSHYFTLHCPRCNSTDITFDSVSIARPGAAYLMDMAGVASPPDPAPDLVLLADFPQVTLWLRCHHCPDEPTFRVTWFEEGPRLTLTFDDGFGDSDALPFAALQPVLA